MVSAIKAPTFADLRAFMAVAEHRSFRRAADLMGLTPSALSHTLRALETSLNTRLLHRTTRSVALTEAGEQLLTRIAPLLGQLNEALEDASGAGGRLSGTLRINGNAGAISLLLRTVVPTFLQRHPGVQLDLVAEGRLVDIVEQGFDAGIRLAEAVPRDMIAIPLEPPIRFLAVAAPAYLQQHPAPQVPDDLAGHRCIRQRLPSGKRYRWEFSRRGQETAIDVPGALTLDDSNLMVEAAVSGLGIAYVPEAQARRALDEGTLRIVLEDWCPPSAGSQLYFPANRHMPPSLRALIDVIREE